MTPEERRDKLYELVVEYKTTEEISDELSEMLLDLVKEVVGMARYKFLITTNEIRNDCEISAILACFESLKRISPDKLRPNGEKTNPVTYFRIVIRCSMARSHLNIVKHKKIYIDESKST